jgi:hypothetical protein
MIRVAGKFLQHGPVGAASAKEARQREHFHEWGFSFAFTTPAPMIFCAFSIVIMTVGLLIANSRAAFANKAR